MSSKLPITLLSLQQLIETENRLIVVDCYAEWCGPCKKISPDISGLEVKYNNEILVLKVDIDECDDISSAFEIKSLPTILYFKHGKLIDKFIGANMEEIEKKIVRYWK
jgi:thioredoxin 1